MKWNERSFPLFTLKMVNQQTYTHTNYNVLGRRFHSDSNGKSENETDNNEWNAVHFVSRFHRHSSHPNQNVAISILPKQKFQPHQMIFFRHLPISKFAECAIFSGKIEVLRLIIHHRLRFFPHLIAFQQRGPVFHYF